MIQGPNVKKLIACRMSTIAIPKGGGFIDGLSFLNDPEKIKAVAKEATEWAEMAIRLVRTAGEPNPWRNSTDEEIAGMLVAKAGERGSNP
jgi:hypothetical protein